MASSKGKMKLEDFDEDETMEELERFDDFTLASSWERFISEIEAICRLWLADGPKNLVGKGASPLGFPKNLYKVKSQLKYGTKSYCLEYYFKTESGKNVEWTDDSHTLQLSFGVKEFLVISPLSASGVVLDAPEASKLLSSLAIALSNCDSVWPAFVPVHDPSRQAYIGIQNLGTVFTRRFEADRIGSQVPIKLMHLEGLYELFVSKFSYSTVEYTTTVAKVQFTMKLTYRTPPHEDDDDSAQVREPMESEENSEGKTQGRTQWDDDCPWTEWYSAENPIKGFELITIWLSKKVESSLEMAELENASLYAADKCFLQPILSPYIGNTIGFASQLRLLVDALGVSYGAQFLEDFVSVENPTSDNLKSSAAVPPPTVLDRVLKDLFPEGAQDVDYVKGEHKNSRAIKGAPLESLFAQFCLHSLWFGSCNIRAIAVLWIEFVREVRWCWEESQLLPRMVSSGSIDLSTCLIHQKLQMLSICIEKKSNSIKDLHKENEEKFDSLRTKQTHGLETSNEDFKTSQQGRRGSSGFAGSMMLLNSCQRMHAPYTQDAPLMTEDMHEERLHALQAFGNAFSFSGQLEKDVLSSDMSAFKAANPDAVFEDFIRWHSPGDWEDDNVNVKGKAREGATDGSAQSDWPPHGKLSKRMSEGGNSWRQIWNSSPALPVSEQKLLLDPNQEGEKILHYLETLRPHQLLGQMVSTAFRASIDTISQTSYGGLKQMEKKIEQLYITISSALKPLQASNSSDKIELIDDLKRLCLVFEHIEKLLTFAASIHRSFLDAPRLSEAIFSQFFSFYLPRMGKGLIEKENVKDFNVKEQVRASERQVILDLFPTPTSNQSWRKVLSMGNLLNGHEPLLREIIFSAYDTMSGGHYESSSPWGSSEEIETHRMYICGTSNDLHVALSVTSCD
ncbi:hypothetical protein H6P81_006511 [Aristolochia fimbriata]|uniref:Rab3 GTPase-activating protein catalytic subunit n=1 Tax=Aristolochia fimbriata TaxID=158543 RepID=A0AAV7EXP1_ARIFI|nr:hypothetical protein H6P81_006511 [Aristolochia fimbriata]